MSDGLFTIMFIAIAIVISVAIGIGFYQQDNMPITVSITYIDGTKEQIKTTHGSFDIHKTSLSVNGRYISLHQIKEWAKIEGN